MYFHSHFNDFENFHQFTSQEIIKKKKTKNFMLVAKNKKYKNSLDENHLPSEIEKT
jgi:hypothetical protein